MPGAQRGASVSQSDSPPRIAPRGRLTKRAHLRKTDDISSVFDFRCSARGRYVACHAKPTSLGYPRVAFLVSKRIAAEAVSRNYMRRVLRELFRAYQRELGSLDLVLRATKKFSRGEFAAISGEMDDIFRQIMKCRNS